MTEHRHTKHTGSSRTQAELFHTPVYLLGRYLLGVSFEDVETA